MVAETENLNAEQQVTVCIVGLGPRGLVTLERLLRFASERPETFVTITAFEPGDPGVGVHRLDQPGFLLLNTVASQLTIFPANEAVTSGLGRSGPTLFEWAQESCAAKALAATRAVGSPPVHEGEFLPRSVLGAYLHWAFHSLMDELPSNVRFTLIKEKASRIEIVDGEKRVIVHGAAGASFTADKLFLTVGHVGSHSKPTEAVRRRCFVESEVEQLQNSLDRATHVPVVAVQGFGLSAMDVVAALTVGRGGRFLREGGADLRYAPSKREPNILLHSRSGLPFRARPRLNPGRRRYVPSIFRADRVSVLRVESLSGQLSLRRDVMPLIYDEMRAAFYIASATITGETPRRIAEIQCEFERADSEHSRRLLFLRLAEQFGEFDPDDYLVTSVPSEISGSTYDTWVKDFLKKDLIESRKGDPGSPIKTALEVLRDVRENIRLAVNHHGLDQESQDDFYSNIAPLVNRTVAGPQLERHEELLALMDMGIVRLSPGPGGTPRASRDERMLELDFERVNGMAAAADYLVTGHIAASTVLDATCPLIASLAKNGLLRPHLGSQIQRGADVSSSGHPVRSDGSCWSNVWLFGPLVEGATYYNHYVPSPGGFSRVFDDADRAADECFATAERVVPSFA